MRHEIASHRRCLGRCFGSVAQAERKLVVAAESDGMIWNAVAVDRGRIFVAGPRVPDRKARLLRLSVWTATRSPIRNIDDRLWHVATVPPRPASARV